MSSKEGYSGEGNGDDRPKQGGFSGEKDKKDNAKDKKKSRKAASKLIGQLSESKEEKIQAQKKEEPKPEKKNAEKEGTEEELYEEELTGEEIELSRLSEEEKQEIAREIRLEAKQERSGEAETSSEDAAVHEALDEYDSKIIEEGAGPDEALRQVLAEHGIESDYFYPFEPEAEPVSEPVSDEMFETRNEELPKEREIPPQILEAQETQWHAASASEQVPESAGHSEQAAAKEDRPLVVTSERVKYVDLSDDYLYSHMWPRSFDYVLGKRRGRIKAERKFKPVQKRLEKEVSELGKKLESQEFTIRKLVAEKAKTDRTPLPKKVEKKYEAVQKREKEPIISQRMEHQRTAAPEAQDLHTAQKAPEAIGHLVITEESKTEKSRQEVPEIKIRPKITRTEYVEPMSRNLETVNQAELLKMSEKVFVNGSSLRQIYETHLIGERGLRRLLLEYKRGGDISKAIRHEIVEREIDFERDPSMRDMGAAGGSGGGGSARVDSGAALKQMIMEAENSVATQEEELAFYKAKAEYEERERIHSQKQRRMLDIGIGAALAILLALILMLYLFKG